MFLTLPEAVIKPWTFLTLRVVCVAEEVAQSRGKAVETCGSMTVKVHWLPHHQRAFWQRTNPSQSEVGGNLFQINFNFGKGKMRQKLMNIFFVTLNYFASPFFVYLFIFSSMIWLWRLHFLKIESSHVKYTIDARFVLKIHLLHPSYLWRGRKQGKLITTKVLSFIW